MSNARWLLSEAALPKAVRPTSQTRTERQFRLPSCIGKSADYIPGRSVVAAEVRSEPAPTGRFAERTMKWFSVGENQAEEERRDHQAMVRRSRWRRTAALVGSASVAAVAIGAVLILV